MLRLLSSNEQYSKYFSRGEGKRQLFLDLTEKGRAMKLQAEKVPAAMRRCIPLETEELLTLRDLLCKAVARMHEPEQEEKAQIGGKTSLPVLNRMNLKTKEEEK